MPTAYLTRTGAGWDMCLCPSPEGVDELQKQNGVDRFELDI
jgi:hypothetical protein